MERPSSHEDSSAAAIEGNFVRSSLLSFPVLEEAGKRELETTGPLSGLPPPPPTLVQKQGSACKTGNVQSSFAHSKWPLLTITGFAQDGRGLGSSWKKKNYWVHNLWSTTQPPNEVWFPHFTNAKQFSEASPCQKRRVGIGRKVQATFTLRILKEGTRM